MTSSNAFVSTGIAEAVLRLATHDGENWIARAGYLLDKRPSQQFGIMYDDLVNAIRAEIPGARSSAFTQKLRRSRPAPTRQKLTLSDGEEISARLVVLANGLNVGLRRSLGIERNVVSALPFDLDRFRHRPRRPAGIRLPGPHLFLRTAERPNSLSDAVSDRKHDAGEPVLLSRRSTIPGFGSFVRRRSKP